MSGVLVPQSELEANVLKSIALSSGSSSSFLTNVSAQDRHEAFRILQEFRTYEGRIPICISWLHQEMLLVGGGDTINSSNNNQNNNNNITIPGKLFALGILQTFVAKGYAQLQENDRLALRYALLNTARQLAPSPSNVGETPILGNKVSSLLANIMIRDFPQRWTTFFTDLFVPTAMGGIWYNNESDVSTMGVKIGLECLKLVTEDCTDSDFNSKISTTRRNDVLIGLNEVSTQFLPLLFKLLEQYMVLVQTKATLHNMRSYLVSQGRTLSQMTNEESNMYKIELNKFDQIGRLIADCLITLERFCRSMPLDWIMGKQQQQQYDGANGMNGNHNIDNNNNNNDTTPPHDFVAALLHLLREPSSNIQVHAISCFEQLSLRKLEERDWYRLVSSLPQAVHEANAAAAEEVEYSKMKVAAESGNSANNNEAENPLVLQLEFHKILSRTLATLVSAHVCHITTNKQIVNGTGPKAQAVAAFLRLSVDMLRHPSGRIAAGQINSWITLLRDPQIVKTNLLTPFVEELLSAYIDTMVRIRWEDVEEQTHPNADILDGSWDDEEEYDAWLCDLRSKSSQLFKFLSHTEPQICAAVISARVQNLLRTYGNGDPRDHLDPTNHQLTPKSTACIQFEGVHQALDNILNGLPSWSLQQQDGSNNSNNNNGNNGNNNNNNINRIQIRENVRGSLRQMADAIVSWNPPYLWLKFRRATLLEALRHYWKHDPSTLLAGIDSLLKYLSAPDEWTQQQQQQQPQQHGENQLSDEVIGLRKKSGVSLVAVSKVVPKHLVPWLAELSDATKTLLSSDTLLPPNRMHLYEFLSCIATAVKDPMERSNFIANVLSDAINTLEAPDVQENISSVERFLTSLGIMQASKYPESVTDPTNVNTVTANYVRMFSAVNQLLSVGKRCHEAARKRPNGGIPMQAMPNSYDMGSMNVQNFPDEGPVSIRDLAINDPFVPLWPRILPQLLQIIDVTLHVWHPEDQAVLLQNQMQRYTYAISDDEAYLSKQHDKSGGVFGEGGTAGSVVAGADRRDVNLVPKWSGWFNELRNTCFQMLGLLAGQRVLYAPEIADIFPRLVSTIANVAHLQAMEHRHFTQFLKQFVEILLLSCPATMYASHLAPILGPVFEHMQYRLEKSWAPLIGSNAKPEYTKALTSQDSVAAAAVASRGAEEWFAPYYARCGLFVGDLDSTTAEAAVEKFRVEFTRTFGDILQSALALKGDWALVLATQAKEEQAAKKNDTSKLASGPRNRLGNDGKKVNADGTPRAENQEAIDARKFLRMNSLCHFLLLEDERIAGSLTLGIIQCLGYPDAYTCRRCTRICHRILETVAWSPKYTHLLGNQMFMMTAKNIVTEPKWMVGIEWDMINVLRDIYCRLVLGQTLQPGGQGAGMQQPRDPNNPAQFEQAKTADRPLQGGGVLVVPSDLPREVLASLPGVGVASVNQLESSMNAKRSAKDQKDVLRDLLRVAAENSKALDTGESGGAAGGLFDRAVAEESLLNKNAGKETVPDIPEKLVTMSMIKKQEKAQAGSPTWHLGLPS